MHNSHDPRVLPMRDGINPSCVVLPSVGEGSLIDFFTTRLSAVSREEWLGRMQRGEVIDELGEPATPERAFVPGLRIYYYRELENEAEIPFESPILFQDEHLLVADKPHFLPVVPSGRFLQHTLLVRLKRETGLRELSPVHRIDRDTAGLVLFSVQRETRGAYQALFRDRVVKKVYEAVARYRSDIAFPREHASRMQECPEQFFRMQEVPGEPNSQTQMEIIEREGEFARYLLKPVTGKRHQLRVHMASLGLPLMGDGFYPVVNDPEEGDWSNPLQLLAKRLEFVDPVTGVLRQFESGRNLRTLGDFVGV
ncbi:pseudouridine synthase [Diaphorobacter sp. HDW4A]|uniref:pseudouridine synthase n=1 Tax=Diaphorobacter sp. HDW4A TaxID=2714924 RepID=UPI00140AE16E|nr:pseudouridine synthase [Diaphorobacter sp. HDW4A]QIL80120.1 pseudouridine synthase [Diaphorobacter sp. HDW4A]